MRLDIKATPREFQAAGITIKDFGKLFLAEHDMVSMVSPGGKECDFTAMSWGFYLAPSLNSRLRAQGFKVALVRNQQGRLFLNAVEVEKLALFQQYLNAQDSKVLCWLDEWEETGQ